MRIICLQFAPQLGKPKENIDKADDVLKHHGDLSGVDVLILPELAFSGYNFPTLEAILPFLEPTKAGITTQWAIKTATTLRCIVIVGYPELASPDAGLVTIPRNDQSSESGSKRRGHDGSLASYHESLMKVESAQQDVSTTTTPRPECYNSLITVSPNGSIISHYRKSFLYYTDETWALEGSGFSTGSLHSLPLATLPPSHSVSQSTSELLSVVTQGICMDINPYKFQTPWETFEFASHVVSTNARMAIISMAWLTHTTPEEWEVEMRERREEVEITTLGYWVERFKPIAQRLDGEPVIVVCANRTGVEGDACYAGSSVVMRLGKGKVEILGMLGRGEESLLDVRTEEEAKWRLQVAKKGEVDEAVNSAEGAS
ncbi:MAG: Carbon-nitrogen hydrolase [Bogoriella megaspora]|nr:MAG: Carbon-nitrogen hydrolase [Bogoriella megaspora]